MSALFSDRERPSGSAGGSPGPAEVSPSAGRRGLAAAICLGLALAVVLVYAPVQGYEFIPCDDDEYVFQSPMVRQGLTWAGARWALTTSHAANWHPLTWLSHMLDVELFGLEPGLHHLTNVGLHALNAVLLFVALRLLTGALAASAVVAALFALHPLRVESVAWVAERKDVLSGLFFMLTLLAYAGYARRPGVLRYLAVFGSAALGLAAKPILVTVPFLLLLLDAWPLRRFGRENALRLVGEKLPLVALAAASSVATLLAQTAGGAVGSSTVLPMAPRLANAALSCVDYLWKTLWPTRLAIFYPHPALVDPGAFSPFALEVGLCVLLLVAVTGLVLWQRRARPYLAVGWLWYLGMLVPVIGLVQAGEQALADRYTYLPLIGVSVAVVFAVGDLAAPRRWARVPLAVAVLALLLGYAGLAARQVRHWRDGQTIFEHALAVTDANYFAHNHLGRSFENRGELESAVAQFEAAIQIRPSPGALSNLGSALSKQGRHEEAIARLEQAIEMDPEFADAYSNLGVVFGLVGQQERAVALYRRALELDPEQSATHYNLGSLLVRYGSAETGARHLERSLALDPFRASAANNLGVAYVKLGRPGDAVNAYRRVLALDPQHAGTHCNLGLAYERLGQTDDAAELYREALRRDPGCVHALRFEGARRFGAGDFDGALALFEQVLARTPQSADSHNDVGSALARRGDLQRAIAHFEAALRLDPEHAAATGNRARAKSDLAARNEGAPD